MIIYLASTFILELGVAVLYYYEQRHTILRELQDEMVAYTSLSRDGSAVEHFEDFSIEVEPSRSHQYPKFYEDNASFVNISCANKFYPEQVFIVSADKKIINTKLMVLIQKIFFLMATGFTLFFGVAYYLARLSIRPIVQANKMVDTIVEDIVHDLNAPMTAIAMNCESLIKNVENAKNIKKIERIETSNQTIRFLYNNLQLLLDKPFTLKIEEVDVVGLLQKRIEFFLELHPEALFKTNFEPLSVQADFYALERVLDNILSNAIKYSQPSPRIEVRTQNNTIVIQDNGIGIKNCSKIFERHHREIQGMECSKGLGLGLSIVQKLCVEMKIAISLQSEYQKGSRFMLSFSNHNK